jgi:succinate dehydrogenase hydrophobic anchor subunit
MADGPRPVLTRAWIRPEGWRDTRVGMWAWLVQRAAALALIAVIVLHLRNPFSRATQACLLGLVLLHGLLGLRAIVLDLGVSLRWQRALVAAALLVGAGLFAAVWAWRWY